MALCLCFAAVTVSADVVWSSAFDFDGSEIVEPVVIPEVNQIGYSMALSSGTVNKELGVIASPEGGLDGREIFFTDDPNDEGTFSWNYINNPLFVKNSNYTLKETIIAYDVPDVTYTRVVHILPEPVALLILGLVGAMFLRRHAKSLLIVLALVSLGSIGVNATTISVGKCFQMWPFERKVIINYTVSDCSGEEYINFYYTTDNGESSYDLRDYGILTGDDGPISANGNYRVIWTPDTETMTTVKGKMKIGVEVYTPPAPPTPSTYMIIDVSGGPNPPGGTYPVSYTDEEPSGGWNINEYKTTKIVLKYCPPGSFTMGSPGDELGRQSDETQRNITLTKGFYVGIFEVTDQQYGEIYNGSWNYYYPTRPIKDVSYATIRGSSWPSSTTPGANSFMDKLNSRTGLSFDLPTEAQWEYACRGETTKATNRDENLSRTGECDEMDRVANYYGNTGIDAVGSKMPSFSGTYDMHGNAGELCLDWYGPYDTDDLIDPTGPDTGSYRVVRGGNCDNDARECRSASRSNTNSAFSFYTGFRLFMVVD